MVGLLKKMKRKLSKGVEKSFKEKVIIIKNY